MPLSRFWVGLNPSSSTIRLLEATQPHWLASRYLSKFQFGAVVGGKDDAHQLRETGGGQGRHAHEPQGQMEDMGLALQAFAAAA